MEHLLITVTLRCTQLKESKCSINIIRPRSFFHTLISKVFIILTEIILTIILIQSLGISSRKLDKMEQLTVID